MKLNAYGKKIEIIRSNDKWRVFYLGDEGKKREASDIFIPSTIKQSELKIIIADLLHESACKGNNKVVEIE